MVQLRDDPEQLALSIGDLCPSPGEEVRVELLLDRVDGNTAHRLVVSDLLYEHVEHFAADELNEVRVPTRLDTDDLNGSIVEHQWATVRLDGLDDRVATGFRGELVEHHDSEHAFSE